MASSIARVDGAGVGMRQFVVMGVAGAGKTSVARLLAEKTGGVFVDADDFHPAVNKAKMAAGIPLADEDRWDWLDALNRQLKAQVGTGRCVFLACSALRQAYRDRLAADLPGLCFIYLRASKEVIRRRLEGRPGFMPVSLLDSQFAILEEPAAAIVVSGDASLSAIVDELLPRIAPLFSSDR